VALYNSVDGFIDANGNTTIGLTDKTYMGNLTITFSQPVNNPMLHVVGLGGQYVYSTEIPTGSGTIVNYAHGFTTEYELVTSGISLSKISGNSALSVTSNEILNTATNLGSPTTPTLINGLTRQAATGSIEIKGIGITTVTFKIYMRGDAGIIYNSSNNPTAATFGNILRWTNQVDFVPSGQPDKISAFNGDKYLLALSLQPCQLISNPSADQSICGGTSGTNITVNTDQNTANSIRFVKFSTDQMSGSTPTPTEAATIYGGTPIATVTPTGASNPYTATYPWNNSNFPTAGTYYVYAILGSAIVGDCYPVQEIKIVVNSSPTVTGCDILTKPIRITMGATDITTPDAQGRTFESYKKYKLSGLEAITGSAITNTNTGGANGTSNQAVYQKLLYTGNYGEVKHKPEWA
jgi:hypothetical protein